VSVLATSNPTVARRYIAPGVRSIVAAIDFR
jgi:hypothetical protein